MREILFRGKRIDNGEWVQGYYFKIWDEHYICWGTTNGEVNKLLVIPETVGQYTGLKDNNGVKIFEGDIVRYGYTVTYIDGQDSNNLGMNVGFYTQRDDFESWAQMEAGGEYEIIGNIYETTEPLEEER